MCRVIEMLTVKILVLSRIVCVLVYVGVCFLFDKIVTVFRKSLSAE